MSRSSRRWATSVREHHAPVGALRHFLGPVVGLVGRVREHHAPVGALRLYTAKIHIAKAGCQGAPRTCRCIETFSGTRVLTSPVHRQGAPRTCRCIETMPAAPMPTMAPSQGAPRTCRCIETPPGRRPSGRRPCQGAPRTCRCIETASVKGKRVVVIESGSTTHL